MTGSRQIFDGQTGTIVPQPQSEPSDGELLYYTLVKDGTLPDGFVDSFLVFADTLGGAATRKFKKMAKMDNTTAAIQLHRMSKVHTLSSISERQVTDQFLLTATVRPRKYITRLQKSMYSGPNARKDAEIAERSKWLQLLATMVINSSTPMGRILAAQPGNIDLLGVDVELAHSVRELEA